MKIIKNQFVLVLLLCIGIPFTAFLFVSAEKEDCTELARDEETLLVFSTLGGGLTAIDPLSSEIRWTIADEPVVKAANQNDFPSPQYLPDPRDGSLYQLGNMGDLKKLPYTIPELVANAPCRSSDGILYSGKKSDTWFLIDPKTGKREKLMGFGGPKDSNKYDGNEHIDESIGWATSRSVYLGRTQYTVLMYDSLSKQKATKPWNITFYDYTSHTMAPEISNEYEYLHLAGSSSGQMVTLDRQQGKFLWQKDLSSPVIAVFLLSSEGLLSVPFSTVADEALRNIVEEAKNGGINEIKLFQSLYIGEHPHGLYAIPSLVDKNTATISADPPPKLIDGKGSNFEKEQKNQQQNRKLVYLDKLLEKEQNVIILGHYQMPKTNGDIELKISASNRKAIDNRQLATIIQTDKDFIILDGGDDETSQTNTVGVQTDQDLIDDNNMILNRSKKTSSNATFSNRKGITKLFDDSKAWLTDQQSGVVHQILLILILAVIVMFWYTCSTVRELRQNSQNGSQTNNRSSGSSNISSQDIIDLGNGEVQVGKITFNCNEVLGKGCEGTFVFKGSFEKRDVAVKRLLPECFSFADREVTLLRESDAHENVVRYFCTEQDRQFRYIAVELCAATLQDYTVGEMSKQLRLQIDVWDVLKQATNGLSHLHSLNIVHRDIKPQNVLLSIPDVNNRVRAMISDFGLCKKLNYGKTSFSRRSGITGTEGWIAPEMVKGQRTTTSVDIFSLGCVFYYVLTEGDHVFGDNLKRQANILSNEYDLKKLISEEQRSSKFVLAKQLIADMINYDAQKRPPAKAIFNHPMFWNEEKILSFLQDVSDRVEKLSYTSEPLRTLEKNGRFIVKEDWNSHLDTIVTDDLKKYRGYTGISVRDLLRAIRNKRHHYHELSYEAQLALGSIPHEFTNYWINKFPNLLSHTYHALRICSKENPFKSYYDENYHFSYPDYFFDDNYESPLVLDGLQTLNKQLNNKHSPKKYNTEKVQKSYKGLYNFHKNQNQLQFDEGGGGGVGGVGDNNNFRKNNNEWGIIGQQNDGTNNNNNNNENNRRNSFANFRFRNRLKGNKNYQQKQVTWTLTENNDGEKNNNNNNNNKGNNDDKENKREK